MMEGSINHWLDASLQVDHRWQKLVDSLRGWIAPHHLLHVSWVIVLLGAVVQLIHYLGQRSLWLDEAMVGLLIKHLSYAELAGKLPFDQVAPIGWLWVEKACLKVIRSPELALRIPQLLATIGAIVFTRLSAGLILRPFGTVATVLLFATSPFVVRYAAEVKPYAIDLFVSSAATYLALSLIRKPEDGALRIAALGLLGCTVIWVSFAAAFTLSAIGVVLLFRSIVQHRRKQAAALIAVGALWLTIAIVTLITVAMPQAAHTTVTTGVAYSYFVQTSFAPRPTSIEALRWYASKARYLLELSFSHSTLPAALLLGPGAIDLIRRDRWVAAILFLPVVPLLTASTLRLYPFFDRLLLFYVSSLFLIAGAGISALSRGRFPHYAVIALVIVVVWPRAHMLERELRKTPPFAHQEIRPFLQTLASSRRPGDTVYINKAAIPAYLFYRSDYGLSGSAWNVMRNGGWQLSCLLSGVARPSNEGDLWFLGADWNDVRPELLTSAEQLRLLGVAAPPELLWQYGMWLLRVPRTTTDVEKPGVEVCEEDPAVDNLTSDTTKAFIRRLDTPVEAGSIPAPSRIEK